MKKIILTAVVICIVLFITVLSSYADTIYGCVAKGSGILRIVSAPGDCKRTETLTSWNSMGPAGSEGPAGPQGPPGVAKGIEQVVGGRIEEDGTASASTGFYLSSHTTTGSYKIGFPTPFQWPPICLVFTHKIATEDIWRLYCSFHSSEVSETGITIYCTRLIDCEWGEVTGLCEQAADAQFDFICFH